MKDFDTITKITLECEDLDKLIVTTSLEKLPKFQ